MSSMSGSSSAVADERRRELCAAEVTLDGLPAKVSGIAHDFATVRLTGSGLGCEWAWETVDLIVTRGGRFRT